jgi:hypothetical protein
LNKGHKVVLEVTFCSSVSLFGLWKYVKPEGLAISMEMGGDLSLGRRLFDVFFGDMNILRT